MRIGSLLICKRKPPTMSVVQIILAMLNVNHLRKARYKYKNHNEK